MQEVQETWVPSLGQEDPLEEDMQPTPVFYPLLCTAAAAAAKSIQSCLTLCDLMDCSLPGSSVCEIFQARIPE